MALKGWTPWFSFLVLIFGMALEAGSVSYQCDKQIVWLRVLKRHPLDLSRARDLEQGVTVPTTSDCHRRRENEESKSSRDLSQNRAARNLFRPQLRSRTSLRCRFCQR